MVMVLIDKLAWFVPWQQFCRGQWVGIPCVRGKVDCTKLLEHPNLPSSKLAPLQENSKPKFKVCIEQIRKSCGWKPSKNTKGPQM